MFRLVVAWCAGSKHCQIVTQRDPTGLFVCNFALSLFEDMNVSEILEVATCKQLREWFEQHHATSDEVWVVCSRKRQAQDGTLPYFDVVYEALCFGWIDSTVKYTSGRTLQRLTPRRNGSHWTELNKERCRMLESEGRMTDAGRAVAPDLRAEFIIDNDIMREILDGTAVASNFAQLPDLYKRVKIGNIQMKRSNAQMFRRRLDRFIEATRLGKMYGEWNDGGKLLSKSAK